MMTMTRSRAAEAFEGDCERELDLREKTEAGAIHDPAVLSWQETIERLKAATELILRS